MASKSIATTVEASTALAEAEAFLAEESTGLVESKPKTLEAVVEFKDSPDGSVVSHKKKYLSVLTTWRTAAEALNEVYQGEKREGKILASAIIALRTTITIPGGAAGPDKPDLFGDSYLWKTYVAPMLKRELEVTFDVETARKIWNTATRHYHSTQLMVPAALVQDAIASGAISKEDAAEYKQVLAAHDNNLGKVQKEAVQKLPESVVTLVNDAIDDSAQARDNWKLVPPAPKQSREQRIKNDPAKAIKEAVNTLKVVAQTDEKGPKFAPLASFDVYYRGMSELLRSCVIGADDKPRKGGVQDKPKVKAVVQQIAEACAGYLEYEDEKLDFDAFLDLLYSDNAEARK